MVHLGFSASDGNAGTDGMGVCANTPGSSRAVALATAELAPVAIGLAYFWKFAQLCGQQATFNQDMWLIFSAHGTVVFNTIT